MIRDSDPDVPIWKVVSFMVATVVAFGFVTIVFIPLLNGEDIFSGPYYQAGTTPDGIYRQRSYVVTNTTVYKDGELSSYSDVENRTVFFPMCDHAYLGPLHGFYKIADGVDFGTGGRFDIKVINQEITAVWCYER